MSTHKIVSNTKNRKEYSYKIKDVELSFTLRQDNTQELLYFKELLLSAIDDVEKDIKNFRK